MEFGIFVQGHLPGAKAHDTEAEHTALLQEMELVKAADKHNWKFAWLSEHHALTEYSHMSSNEAHAAYLAACTERIHIGSGIFNLSPRVNNPVKTAEKVATLDHLTNRRFEFGTGRGAGSHEVGTFNIHDKDSTRAEYDEVVWEIDRMWEQKDYTFQGQHFKMDVPHNVLPKPYGPGHPPFWLAVGSPPTWKKAGLLGQGALGFTFGSVHDIKPWIADYKEGISNCKNPVGQFVNDNAMITSGVQIAYDREVARERAARPGNGYLVSMVALYHDTMPTRPGMTRWPAKPIGATLDTLDDFIKGGFLLCGSPEEICEQLQPYVAAGVDQLAFGVPGDGSYEEALEMIEVFGKSVIPEFDRDPVISTDRYRATAKPKYATFNKEPLPISTLHTP